MMRGSAVSISPSKKLKPPVAVSFDIIDKLKELALGGDKEAEKQIEDFDKARRIGDISKSLKFEREILTICRDKLELISPVEFIDLERLQEDRNRCAHPSMTADGEIFNPSAELARMHIRSAVEHLLQYPPAQGKYALDSLLAEVESVYFPTDIKKAIIAFEKSPLNKARDSLVRNFTILLLKKLINDTEEFKEISRITTALNAVGSMHTESYSKTLKEKVSSIIRALDSDKLSRVTPLINRVKDSWSYFDADVKQKIESYVENLSKEQLDDIDIFLEFADLKKAAETRIRFATRAELKDTLFLVVPEQVGDKIIDLYSNSSSFDHANSFASTVIRNASDYSKSQIEKIIKACGENEQITYSFEIGNVINAIRKNSKVSEDEVNEWLRAADLKKYIKEKEEDDDL